MFTLPNILTASNLLCGILAIIFTLYGRIDLAPVLILFALVFDFLDGFLARKMKLSGELGKQLDSLADMITFGVAPGIMCFVLLIISGGHEIVHSIDATASPFLYDTFGTSINALITMYLSDLTGNPLSQAAFHYSGWYLFSPFIALVIPFFSLFRLAKFNLDTRQSDRFIGLPTPALTLFFMVFPLILWDAWGEEGWRVFLANLVLKESILTGLIVLFSALLVAEIPLIALKFKDYSWKKNKLKYILIVSSGLFMVFFSFRAIPLIIFTYLCLSFIDNFMEKRKK
jgi:CDP-diacylglycerol---serine O-phosphatidyltransferase